MTISTRHAQKIVDDFIDLYWPMESNSILAVDPVRFVRYVGWHLRGNGHPSPEYQVLTGWSNLEGNESDRPSPIGVPLAAKLVVMLDTSNPVAFVQEVAAWLKAAGIKGWHNVRYTKDKYVPTDEEAEAIRATGGTA